MFLSKRKRKVEEPDVRTAEGFTIFYDTYLNYVYSICYRYLTDKSECKDIVSKIFISIWERRETLYQDYLDHEGDWKGYLAKAAKLKMYDYLRKRARRKKYMEVDVHETASFENTTEDEISFDELDEQIDVLVNQLPPRCKEVFKLSRNRGLTNKEVASQLGISDNTVKTHLAKALGHLRKHLTDYSIPKRAIGS